MKKDELQVKIEKALQENQIYSNNIMIYEKLGLLVLDYVIDGDWKHEHLFSENVVESVLNDLGISFMNRGVIEILDDTGCDYYEGMHRFIIVA